MRRECADSDTLLSFTCGWDLGLAGAFIEHGERRCWLLLWRGDISRFA